MKRNISLVTLMLIMTLFFALSANVYASSSGELNEIEIIVGSGSETQENVYVPSRGSSSEAENSAIPDELKKILNGEDYASDLFGTDRFQPANVDTSWLSPFINFVAVVAASACGLFSAFMLFQMLIDVFCILLPSLGKLLHSWNISWFYSDTAAALVGLPLAEGRQAQTINDMPTNKGGKVLYLVKDSMVTAVLSGAVLICIANGLLPKFINVFINILVNGLAWVYNWITTL